LVYAHEDQHTYGRVLESTTGIVFLATPHRGSDTANLADVVYTIINTFMTIGTGGLRPKAARAELLEYLSRNSYALQDLLVSVRHRLQNLSVVTFYENRVMPPLSSLVNQEPFFLHDLEALFNMTLPTDRRSCVCRTWYI
jgi:hypothetical protein